MKTLKSILNTKEADNAELHCEFESSIKSNVTWFKDGAQLRISTTQPKLKHYEKTNVLADNKYNSILVVNNVDKNDLGQYMCQVQSGYGSQNVNITLTYVPEPPVLQAPIERDGQNTITHWHIRSLQPLTEVMLKYRRKNVRQPLFVNYLFNET